MDKKKICLALQGGGSYGAFTWGALEQFLESNQLEFDSISATSAGSINAVLLADGFNKNGIEGAIQTLNSFWSALGKCGNILSPIKHSSSTTLTNLELFGQGSYFIYDLLLKTFSPYVLNPYNFNLLRELLLQFVDFHQLQKYSKIKLFISATNVRNGQLKIFSNKSITIDTILASTCLPYLSQAAKIDNEFYWDGGYLGNPAIFPLIYNSSVKDILIIHTNPIKREDIPKSSPEIENRINEIAFNSSLVRELRTIAFINNLIDSDCIKKDYTPKLQKKYFHILSSDEVMHTFSLYTKFNWSESFILHLKTLGKETALKWLRHNYGYIGNKTTLNFSEFFDVEEYINPD